MGCILVGQVEEGGAAQERGKGTGRAKVAGPREEKEAGDFGPQGKEDFVYFQLLEILNSTQFKFKHDAKLKIKTKLNTQKRDKITNSRNTKK